MHIENSKWHKISSGINTISYFSSTYNSRSDKNVSGGVAQKYGSQIPYKLFFELSPKIFFGFNSNLMNQLTKCLNYLLRNNFPMSFSSRCIMSSMK